MKSGLKKIITALAITGTAFAWAPSALGHAFPQREEPGVGSVVHQPPSRVRIWFDSKLEPAFSSLVVKDSEGHKVSGESRVDNESQQRLEVKLHPLTPGKYHVYWKAVAWDGHHSEGDYSFNVKP